MLPSHGFSKGDENVPIFTSKPKETKKEGSAAGVAQETIEKYRPFIEELDKNHIGRLELEKDYESLMTVRKALLAAGEQVRRYVKVRKARGEPNVLELERLTRKEYMEGRKATQQTAERITQAKSAPKAKANPKAKAKAKKKS